MSDRLPANLPPDTAFTVSSTCADCRVGACREVPAPYYLFRSLASQIRHGLLIESPRRWVSTHYQDIWGADERLRLLIRDFHKEQSRHRAAARGALIHAGIKPLLLRKSPSPKEDYGVSAIADIIAAKKKRERREEMAKNPHHVLDFTTAKATAAVAAISAALLSDSVDESGVGPGWNNAVRTGSLGPSDTESSAAVSPIDAAAADIDLPHLYGLDMPASVDKRSFLLEEVPVLQPETSYHERAYVDNRSRKMVNGLAYQSPYSEATDLTVYMTSMGDGDDAYSQDTSLPFLLEDLPISGPDPIYHNHPYLDDLSWRTLDGPPYPPSTHANEALRPASSMNSIVDVNDTYHHDGFLPYTYSAPWPGPALQPLRIMQSHWLTPLMEHYGDLTQGPLLEKEQHLVT